MSGRFVSQPPFLFQVCQTKSKTKTLKIVLESFCVHLPNHAFFYFFLEVLLAFPLFPPSNLLFFTVESTLSSPCSRCDRPLSRQGAALAYLDSFPPHDLVLWTDGSVRFPFDKGASSVLANCSLRGTEATLSFIADPACSSFSAKICDILQALCWSRQHQQVCHFSSLLLLSVSRSVLATLSSPPSFLLS